MKIAVLDDNLPIGEMLQQALELAGHTIIVYVSPSEFLANIEEQARSRAQFGLGREHRRKQRTPALAAADYQLLRPHQPADRSAQFHSFCAGFGDHGLVGGTIGPKR